MAEQFTEAGQIGKDIRSKLGSAVKAAGSGAMLLVWLTSQ